MAGAALDVMTQEPPVSSPLFGRDNVIITPHTSFYSEESLRRTAGARRPQEVVAVLSGQAATQSGQPRGSSHSDESDGADGARGTGPGTM